MLHRHYETIDSTNDQAAALARQGESLPLLVSATTQTGGRGRLGRSWQSPFGGAWFTLAYREPAQVDETIAGLVPLAAAAAIWQAIADMAEVMGDSSLSGVGASARLRIKWPNDLLIDDRKVAGILCQRTVGASSGGASVGIIGVGINVNNDPKKLGPVRLPATSLTESIKAGRAGGRGGVGGREGGDVSALVQISGERLVDQLNILWRDGLTAGFGQWFEQRMAYVGRHVTWHEQGVDAGGGGVSLGLNYPGHPHGLPDGLGGLLVQPPGQAVRVIIGHEVDHLAAS